MPLLWLRSLVYILFLFLSQIESQFVQSHQLKTMKVEGMEEEFLTKAQINRAWNQKKKLQMDGDEISVVISSFSWSNMEDRVPKHHKNRYQITFVH